MKKLITSILALALLAGMAGTTAYAQPEKANGTPAAEASGADIAPTQFSETAALTPVTRDAGTYGAVGENDPMYWMGRENKNSGISAQVWFGNYWQADTANKTPVHWTAMSSGSDWFHYPGQVTLVGADALNAVPFNTVANAPYWYSRRDNKSSTLRLWMNGMYGMITDKADDYSGTFGKLNGLKEPFYTAAFTPAERDLISPTVINIERGPGGAPGEWYGNNGVPTSVTDKVFTMSEADEAAYMGYPDNQSILGVQFGRTVGVSSNAKNPGFTVSGQAVSSNHYVDSIQDHTTAYWWLRSPYASDNSSSLLGIAVSFYRSVSDSGKAGTIATNAANIGAVPVVNLDPSRVMFVPANAQGYAPAVSPQIPNDIPPQVVAGSVRPPMPYYRVFTRGGASGTTNVYKKADPRKIQVTYSGAAPGDYLSVLVVSTDSHYHSSSPNNTDRRGYKWTGRVAQVWDAYGGVEVTLPASYINMTTNAAGYKVFAWLENEGSRRTSLPVGYNLNELATEPPKPWIGGQVQDPAGWAQAKNIGASVNDGGVGGNGLNRVFYSMDANAADGPRMTDTGNGWYVGWGLTVPGQYYIIAYNNAGGRSVVPIWVDNIDRAGPSIADQGQAPAGWAASKSIGANVWDTESGLNRVFYSTDPNATTGTGMTYQSGNWYTAAGLTVPGTYYVIAYDNVGNRSAAPIEVNNIDRIPPTMGAAAIAPAGWNSAASYTITVPSVTDTGGSGVAGVEYSTDSSFATGVANMTLAGDNASATVTPPEGSTTYYIRAKDGAGNVSQTQSVSAQRDSTIPVVGSAAQSPGASVWAPEKKIAADVTDAGGSGLRRVWYSDSASDPAAFVGTLTHMDGDTYTAEGIGTAGTYYVWAEDNARNRTATGMAVNVTDVDGVPPVITQIRKVATGGTQILSARIIDELAGVDPARVYCATDPAVDSGAPMTKESGSDVWSSAEMPADNAAYYVIACDLAGNKAVAGQGSLTSDIPLNGIITFTDQNRTVDIDGDGKPDATVNDLVDPADIIDVSVPLNVMVAVQYVAGSEPQFFSGLGTVTNNSAYSSVHVDVVQFQKKEGQAGTVRLVPWDDPAGFADPNNDIALKLRTPGNMAYGSLYDVTGLTDTAPAPMGILGIGQSATFDFMAAFGNAFALEHKDDTYRTEFRDVFRFTKGN